MKSFVKISLFACFIIIAAACQMYAQCTPESNFAASYDRLILSNYVNKDCRVSDPVRNANDLLGLGVVEKPSQASSGVTVSGQPDITFTSFPDNDKDKNYMDGIFHAALMIICTGAATPRISWGTTRLYYSQPFETNSELREFKGGSIGLGEADKDSVSLRGTDRTEGGARIFPMTEQIGCIDLDHREQSMTLKDVKGTVRLIPPSIRQIGEIKYAMPSDNPGINPDDKRFAENPDETFDSFHIPVGKLVTVCYILNIHPVGDESFQLIQGGSSLDKYIHTYKENDPHAFNPCETITFDKAGIYGMYLRWIPYNDPHAFNPCETITFDKAGIYGMYLRWIPYKVESNRIPVEAVNK